MVHKCQGWDRCSSWAGGGIVMPWGSLGEVAPCLSGFQPCVHGAGDEHHGLAGKNAGTPRALPAPPPWQPRGRRLAGAPIGKAPLSLGAKEWKISQSLPRAILLFSKEASPCHSHHHHHCHNHHHYHGWCHQHQHHHLLCSHHPTIAVIPISTSTWSTLLPPLSPLFCSLFFKKIRNSTTHYLIQFF